MSKIKVAVLGCTGMVGQAFIWLLAGHKQFELSFLALLPKGITGFMEMR